MKILSVILIVLLTIVTCLFFFASCTPAGRTTWNNYRFGMQKVDDRTAYANLKVVEDTARAMISSYEGDKLTYKQYVGNTNTEKASWAEQAKMRANKTAATYNNYILQNSFLWKDNIPADIYRTLGYIE